jgi:nucleotide-binding universal stress UspA family protein
MPNVSPVRHVLALVDGTESSLHAADMAIELAMALGARMTAMAIVDTDTLRQLLSVRILVDAEMGEFERELQESARRHLHDVRLRAAARDLVIDEVLTTGNSEAIVPKEVAARGIDLIAVGGFHSSRTGRDLLARQRQQIIDHAVCPVLVVK